MQFEDIVYVGIDPKAGARPIEFAAMDKQKRVIVLDRNNVETVLAYITGLGAAMVAIAAPQSPNQGLMRKSAIRRRYKLRSDGHTWTKWRVCEYELRRRNIRLHNTPDTLEAAPRWVQNGFLFYRRLSEMGFQAYSHGKEFDRQTYFEVSPHACYSVLLERRPLLKRTLEGRMQRQLFLYLEGLDVANPLYVLEEITRYHLLTGNLPLEGLYESDPLDALVAAYTAFLAGEEPERVCQVGEKVEGLITVPVGELLDFYP
ncbi:MAG: DUF429 domain-containing protein [Anaerolineales bacterium]|nr:DUF429 domain-containing protein [Anaerolineales bacterium]